MIFRSRVISCHSRAIGQKSSNFRLHARFIVIFIFQYMRYEIQYGMIGNLRPDGGMMMRYRYGNRTGFLGVLAPSESVEDRTVVGPGDHV